MISCNAIDKTYQRSSVLEGATLHIKAGESVAITGVSGSGKSTLLNLIAGLDSVDAGEIILNDTVITSLSDEAISAFRKKNIGFVFQFHHLLPDFTLLENIAMPLLINGIGKQQAFTQAKDLLSDIGLGDKAGHFISMLSGGQRQRGAILRAIIHNPAIILADEPTGNLDEENTHLVLELLLHLCSQNNTTLLMATHNQELARTLTTTYTLVDKQLCKQL